MEIKEAIRNRRSIRGFKATPAPREVLDELLDLCRWAPSYRSMQSWEFAVLGGKLLAELREQIKGMARKNVPIHPELPSLELPKLYMKRATALRDKMDCHQFPPGTAQLAEKRIEYGIAGAGFHNAPNVILMYSEKALLPWSVCEAGIMAQTMALAAPSFGLGTCLMAKPTYWPELIRDAIKLPESKVIIMAVAIGYPDSGMVVNTCERSREPIQEFVHYYGV